MTDDRNLIDRPWTLADIVDLLREMIDDTIAGVDGMQDWTPELLVSFVESEAEEAWEVSWQDNQPQCGWEAVEAAIGPLVHLALALRPKPPEDVDRLHEELASLSEELHAMASERNHVARERDQAETDLAATQASLATVCDDLARCRAELAACQMSLQVLTDLPRAEVIAELDQPDFDEAMRVAMQAYFRRCFGVFLTPEAAVQAWDVVDAHEAHVMATET